MNDNEKNKLNSAFGDIDEKLIDEAAAPISGRRRTAITRLIASCAVLLLVALPLSYILIQNNWSAPLPLPPEETTGAAPLNSLPAGDSEASTPGEPSVPDAPVNTQPETYPQEETTGAAPLNSLPASDLEASTPGEPSVPDDPVNTQPETYSQETVPPFTLPEAPLPTVTITSNGKTKEMTSFCVGGSYTDGNREASFDGYCAQDGLNGVGGKSFETVFFNPDDFSINLTGVTVNGYTVFKITGNSNSKYPEFELSPIKINDISEMADYPGDFYVVIAATYKDSNWTIAAQYAIRLYVSKVNDEVIRIPGGSIYNVLEVSAGGKTVTLKKYMVFEERYDDLSHDHRWIFADGLGFENGFSMDSKGIPEIEYSPDISLKLQTNSTLHSITLWSGDPKAPSTQTISISSIEEIASYPGTWYAVFSVTNTGAYVKAPDGSAYERACHDHVVRITVN